MILRFLTLFALLLPLAAAADDDEARFSFAGDRFLAGATITHDEDGTDDLFIAGETVRASADITGTAHMAGRRVTLTGSVGGDLYAMGMDVTLTGAVAGDATVTGYEVTLGAIGGDVRASGAELTLNGPVGGSALLAADEITIEGVIAGPVSLAARSLDFGRDARIEGQLTLYEEEPGALEVPARVAPPDRILRRQIEGWEDVPRALRPFSWGRAIAKFLMGVIVVAGLAALIAALVPEKLAQLRRDILARPFHTLWLGFLTESAVIGSGILFAMTLIGMVLTPGAFLLAFLGGFAGYVVGVYAFGVGLMLAFGRAEPDSIGDRALAAGIGALTAGVLALIPLLGWLFVLAVTLAGVGAVTQFLFRPQFFSDPV